MSSQLPQYDADASDERAGIRPRDGTRPTDAENTHILRYRYKESPFGLHRTETGATVESGTEYSKGSLMGEDGAGLVTISPSDLLNIGPSQQEHIEPSATTEHIVEGVDSDSRSTSLTPPPISLSPPDLEEYGPSLPSVDEDESPLPPSDADEPSRSSRTRRGLEWLANRRVGRLNVEKRSVDIKRGVLRLSRHGTEDANRK